MKTLGKFLLVFLVGLLILVLVVPLLIPVPPLEGVVAPEQLADPDSRFVDVDGLKVHYKIAGSGEPTWILMHGFAASLFSWREVIAPLSRMGTVVAFDRPAFGLTERPMEWSGANPYSAEFQADLTVGLMDQLGIEQAILVGNSAGGTVAALTALRDPQRVQGLVLVDPAIYTSGGSPAWFRLFANTPQMQRIGPLLARNIRDWGLNFARLAWHDPSRITDEVWAGYTEPLLAENWDRALWNLTAASKNLKLDERLDELQLPVLVITGDDDRIVPTADSVRLASDLPQADLVVIPNCGHVPQEECPQAFMEAVQGFWGE